MRYAFDHAYTADHRHRFFKLLGSLGFEQFTDTVIHPGGCVCKFIKFKTASNQLVYLEFIHVRAGGSPIHEPGLSFKSLVSLKREFQNLKKNFDCQFSHRNYNWQANSKEMLPGWNFVDFKNRGFRGIYPWLTEYEKSASKPNKKKKESPNQRYRFHGLELSLNENGFKFFDKLFKGKLKSFNKLPCGSFLYIKESRNNRLSNIILETKSLSKKLKNKTTLTEFKGGPAYELKNPRQGFNIIVAGSHAAR